MNPEKAHDKKLLNNLRNKISLDRKENYISIYKMEERDNDGAVEQFVVLLTMEETSARVILEKVNDDCSKENIDAFLAIRDHRHLNQ